MKKGYLFVLIILSLLILDSCGNKADESLATTAIIDEVEENLDNETVIVENTNNSMIAEEVDYMDEFYVQEIDSKIFSRINGLSYKEDCTVPVEQLRYLHIMHKTLDGKSMEGELIVNEKIADTVLDIFKELYLQDYPIESVKLVDEFEADDEKSMSANNSSAFNFRFISHTTTVSKHGLGMAIDINPRYNPYIKEVNGRLNVEPANGIEYVDRSLTFDYKIDENDLAYKLFTQAGFTWGGSWKNSKDYQHFEME